MTKKPTVMFYVQHLLGIGHVFRAMRVARGLAKSGCETHIVWGGKKISTMNTQGVQMHFLQAVHVGDEDFKALLLDDKMPISDEGKSQRAAHLVDLFHTIKPDIVIAEAFPFGRRQMRFELLPLMDAAKNATPKPLVVCSIRDILQENRAPKRVRESLDAIHEWYDLVMVHGDPELIPIETTLDHAEEIEGKIRYTGLVTPDPIDAQSTPSLTPDVIVSAGGGAVGQFLMSVAVRAMEHCKELPTNWCLTTGPDLNQVEFDKLVQAAPDGMQVTRFITDLATVMKQAKVSVSRAGYNTVGDLLRAQCPAVLVPFVGGLETEQLRRAKMIEDQGLGTVLMDADLTPQSFAMAVDRASNLESKAATFDLNGAQNAAQILISEFESRR